MSPHPLHAACLPHHPTAGSPSFNLSPPSPPPKPALLAPYNPSAASQKPPRLLRSPPCGLTPPPARMDPALPPGPAPRTPAPQRSSCSSGSPPRSPPSPSPSRRSPPRSPPAPAPAPWPPARLTEHLPPPAAALSGSGRRKWSWRAPGLGPAAGRHGHCRPRGRRHDGGRQGNGGKGRGVRGGGEHSVSEISDINRSLVKSGVIYFKASVRLWHSFFVVRVCPFGLFFPCGEALWS